MPPTRPKTHPKRSPKSSAKQRGQIIPRGDSKWLVRFFIGRDPHTGKRRYGSETVEGTYITATKALTKQLAKVDDGSYRAPTKQTLGAYLRDTWLADQAAHVKSGSLTPRTFGDYGRAVDKLTELYGAMLLGSLTRADVAILKRKLMELYGPSAAARAFDVFRMAMKRAVELELIATNPGVAERRIPTPKPKTDVLTVEQVGRFLTAAERYRYGHYSALLHVLLLGGLRPGEAVALQWRDLDGNALRVERAVTIGVDGSFVLGPTKTREVRTVLLLPAAVEALSAHRKRQRTSILQRGARGAWEDAGRWIFPNVNGDLMLVERARKVWKAVLKRAGLPPVRLYDARHTYVTALLQQGVDARTVADLAGHKDPAMTLRRYAHSSVASKQSAVDKLQAAISGAFSQTA
jgi:integrase